MHIINKITKLFILVVGIFLMIPFMVSASTTPKVLTLDASISENKLAVSGTTEDGVLAVAIFVYDKTETNLITMKTTAVNQDNTYSDKIDVQKGNYIVKAVNYDGGDYVTKNVFIETKTSSNPNTGDSILKYGLLLLVSIIGISTIFVFIKKKANN